MKTNILPQMSKNLTKQLIAHVDSEVARKFQDMLEDRAQVQRSVMETLLKVWLALPIEIQAKLQKGSISDYYVTLCNELVYAEVDSKMKELGVDVVRFLRILRQATKPASRKK